MAEIKCEHCDAELLFGVDHWCRCTDCGAELPNNDYDDLCGRCAGIAKMDAKREAYYERNWHRDHGDFE
jgi:predicted amidophosphoribosyltransferase